MAPNTTPVEAQARGLSSLAGIFGEAAASQPTSRDPILALPFLRQEMSILRHNRTSQPHENPSVASRRDGGFSHGFSASGGISVMVINAYM